MLETELVSTDEIRKHVIMDLPLSRREKEVASLVSEGLSNPEIAQILDVSLNTIKFHNKRIFDKMGIDSRTALINYVFNKSIIAALQMHYPGAEFKLAQ